MKHLIFVSCTALMVACTSAPQPAAESKSTTSEAKPAQPAAAQEPTTPLELLAASEGFKEWGYLIGSTKWAASLSNTNYTLLAFSRDVLMESNPELLSSMKLPENKAALEKLVGRHILTSPLYDAQNQLQSEVTTISGEKLKIDTKEMTIEGVPFSTDRFETKSGRVVEIKFPIGLREKDFVMMKGI